MKVTCWCIPHQSESVPVPGHSTAGLCTLRPPWGRPLIGPPASVPASHWSLTRGWGPLAGVSAVASDRGCSHHPDMRHQHRDTGALQQNWPAGTTRDIRYPHFYLKMVEICFKPTTKSTADKFRNNLEPILSWKFESQTKQMCILVNGRTWSLIFSTFPS